MWALGLRLLALAFVAPPQPWVRTVDCPDLSAERISEYLAVEHPEFRDAGAPRVELTCTQSSVVIVVEDTVTAKRLERTIDAPPPETEGRERQIALATSSLIVASWMELLVPPEEIHPPLPPPTAETRAAHQVADAAAREDPQGAVQFIAAVRFRDLGEGLVVSHAGLRGGRYFGDHLEVFGQVGVEYGQTNRDRGQVGAFAALAGPGVAWTWGRDRPVGLETWAAVAAGYARLAGRTSLPDVEPGVLGGATGEAELGLGPRFTAGAFVMVVDLRAGYTLPNPRGSVTGEASAQHGGFWAGVGLRVGGLLGGRRRRHASRTTSKVHGGGDPPERQPPPPSSFAPSPPGAPPVVSGAAVSASPLSSPSVGLGALPARSAPANVPIVRRSTVVFPARSLTWIRTSRSTSWVGSSTMTWPAAAACGASTESQAPCSVTTQIVRDGRSIPAPTSTVPTVSSAPSPSRSTDAARVGGVVSSSNEAPAPAPVSIQRPSNASSLSVMSVG